ncbi:TIR domain-containing protein [bacterium]|nr:TIR domain-containing protein [bacterium]
MIFINYRKNDTQTTVDHLADRLKGAFGPENVFKDDSNLQGGDRWLARLRAELSRARVLVAVIGPSWLKAADDHGRRRLDDPNDWVRVEICTALRDGKPVVVVLADGAAVPPAAGLPTGCELEQLSDIQKVELRKGADRTRDLKDLIQLLARLTELPVRPTADPAAAADVTPLPPAPAVFFGRDDVLAALRSRIVPADANKPLPKVPVTGIGGMGKSTLTAALLHDPAVVERYGDRRHFAKLDGADGLPLLLEKLAGALGVPLGAGLTNRIVSTARIGGPRLLVLDNLETPLRDEAQQPEVLEFLEQLGSVC